VSVPAPRMGTEFAAERSAWKGAALLLPLVAVALAALLATNPPVAAGCAVGIALVALSAALPLYGLVAILTVISLVGSDSVFHLHFGWQWVEVDLLLAIAFLGWAGRRIATAGTIRLRRLDIALALFAVAVAVGVYKGLSAGYAFEELRSELRPPAYLILVYAISRTSIREPATFRRVLTVLIIGALVSALKVLFVYAAAPLPLAGAPEQTVWATRVMNSGGTKRVIAQGAEIFPLLMTLCILPRLAVIESLGKRLLARAAACLLLLAVVLSMTRSYWLGFAAGLLALIGVHRVRGSLRISAEIAGVGVVLLCAVFLLQSLVPGFDADRFAGELGHRALGAILGGPDPSVQGRLDEVGAILDLVVANPWTGTGLGGTYIFYSSIGGGIREWEFTHNSYAFWAMKLGILGLLSALAVLLLGLLAAAGWLRQTTSRQERAVASGLLAALVALFTTSLTAPWLTHYVGAAWAGLAIGGCESMRLAGERASGVAG